jgi:hypothetical protein
MFYQIRTVDAYSILEVIWSATLCGFTRIEVTILAAMTARLPYISQRHCIFTVFTRVQDDADLRRLPKKHVCDGRNIFIEI